MYWQGHFEVILKQITEVVCLCHFAYEIQLVLTRKKPTVHVIKQTSEFSGSFDVFLLWGRQQY